MVYSTLLGLPASVLFVREIKSEDLRETVEVLIIDIR